MIKGDIDSALHLFSRHRSLQYFTSAQFLAQRRRQLMGKPQPSQGLLGKAALLPRKEGVRDDIRRSRSRVSLAERTSNARLLQNSLLSKTE
jgi:hypothetical protein